MKGERLNVSMTTIQLFKRLPQCLQYHSFASRYSVDNIDSYIYSIKELISQLFSVSVSLLLIALLLLGRSGEIVVG
jgi:hypothetical protein